MRGSRLAIAAVVAALTAGCAVMPSAPMIAALPGSQKSGLEFQNDDSACRGEANAMVATASANGASYSLQQYYDAKYLQCMYARGNRVPAMFVQDSYVQPPSGVPPYPPRDYPPPTGVPPAAPPASSASPK